MQPPHRNDAFPGVPHRLAGAGRRPQQRGGGVCAHRREPADIEVKGRTALIRGVPRLHGASLVAGDLRGAAALVVAALGAEGESEVLDLSHLDRGYEDLPHKLKRLGAKIARVRV